MALLDKFRQVATSLGIYTIYGTKNILDKATTFESHQKVWTILGRFGQF